MVTQTLGEVVVEDINVDYLVDPLYAPPLGQEAKDSVVPALFAIGLFGFLFIRTLKALEKKYGLDKDPY